MDEVLVTVREKLYMDSAESQNRSVWTGRSSRKTYLSDKRHPL